MGEVAAQIKAKLSQKTRIRENDKLNDIIKEIGRSLKRGKKVRPQIWNDLNASSARYYNAQPKEIGPQTYRPRRADKIVRRKLNAATKFASASRNLDLVFKKSRRKNGSHSYFLASPFKPDTKWSTGQTSSFGRQVAAKSSFSGKHSGRTAPSYTIQHRWKAKPPVVDESFQPTTYSSFGGQLQSGFRSEGSIVFAAGRDLMYAERHAETISDSKNVGPQTYKPKTTLTKRNAAAYSMAIGRGDMSQKVTVRGEVNAAVGLYDIGFVYYCE